MSFDKGMADLGTLITIANSVYQLSQSQVVKDMKDWQSELEKLSKSVSFIKNMLLDADTKPELSHGEHAWIEELKEVLYEADDLFDEVITIAKVKELDESARFSKKAVDKVSRFFSPKNRFLVGYNTSQEIKSIQQKLDAIARDHGRYEFKVDPPATLNRRREDTCSFLDETHENIIGREDDVKDVVDMVLDPNVEENVGFVAVVGIGGLGKTTLARLVYNHDLVESRFEKKLWACVSDQDGKKLDVQSILSNIIESSRNKKPCDVSTMQSMQTEFQEELKNKTYLLILDDVWTEDYNEWSKLRRHLTIGGRGSRVVITTRSEKTAEVVLGKATRSKKYMLKGLSDDDSWRLFVSTAFERESDHVHDTELTNIGKIIVKRCANVPLAIKVVGALLYGQSHRWESFEKNQLPQIETTKNLIVSILKDSYNNLEPSVKNCFKYCALFPKDFKMDKQKLINLWMAQGYIDDSEDYFLILLKRCFFQDVEKDEFGNVVSFKMHDFMHDLAQEVVGNEIIVANCPPNNLSPKTRHIFLDGEEWTKSSFHKRNIRTCYMNRRIPLDLVDSLVANWRCLRSLRLYVPDAENLPDSIGELLHLRYLDLSRNVKLKTLPNSIAKLYNLQSLIMVGCSTWKEWPICFYKLVNLRLLDIRDCPELTYMPLGIGQLTNLRDLTNFKVGTSSFIGNQFGGELKDIKSLVNLRGELDIRIFKDLVSYTGNVWQDGYWEHIKNLKVLAIHFNVKARPIDNEALIAKLQPNRNLMQLSLYGYNGTEIPRWGRAAQDWAISLPYLVKIELEGIERLHGIPLFSNLKHLKFLSLFMSNSLEYMETRAISRYSSRSKGLPFFPSLEHLSIWCLKRLKGWWAGDAEGDSSRGGPHWQPPFPRLSTLIINSCPELTSFPPCPSLELLEVINSNKSLRILPGEEPQNLDLKLRVREIDSVGYLTTLPACRLTHIMIKADQELRRLSEIELVLKSSSSLQSLNINRCTRLTSFTGGLEHLTALESLSLINVPAEVFDDEMPWKSLCHNLRSLELEFLNTLQILPTGMKHLTALQNMSIIRCNSLKGLPEWISCLSSLHSLKIRSCLGFKSLGAIKNITFLQELGIFYCPNLTEACKEPRGKEWPSIRHIPHISIL